MQGDEEQRSRRWDDLRLFEFRVLSLEKDSDEQRASRSKMWEKINDHSVQLGQLTRLPEKVEELTRRNALIMGSVGVITFLINAAISVYGAIHR